MKKLFPFKKTKGLSCIFGATLTMFSCQNDTENLTLENTLSNNLSSASVELSVSSTTADEEQSANPASNATDTDGESRWSGFGDPVNLDLDLGSVSLIDYVNIAYHKGDERISSFQAYTSSDNSNWTLVGVKNSSGSTEELETFDLTNTSARYLRLTNTGNSDNEWNSILDIEVYGTEGEIGTVTTTTSENLAQGKSTNQSSTAYSGVSSRAVDGDTNGIWSQGSVTHTSNSTQPWWTVNLESDYSIGEVIVYNRTNCCMDRLNDFNIDVLDSSGSVVSTIYVSDTPTPSVSVDFDGASGSTVRVRLNGTNPLSLAEVEVYEYDGDTPTVTPEPTPTPTTPTTSNSGTFDLEDLQIETSWLTGEDSRTTESFTATSEDDEDWYDKDGDTYWLKSLQTDGNRTEWKEYPGKEASLSTYKRMQYEAKVEDIPENGVTIAQVHNRGGVNRPLLRVYIDEDRYIKIKVTTTDPTASSSSYNTYTGPFYTEGTDFTVEILTQDGEAYINVVTTNGSMSETIDPSGDWDDFSNDYYLKAGVYTEGDDTNPKITFDYFLLDK